MIAAITMQVPIVNAEKKIHMPSLIGFLDMLYFP
jgi:hypothetical protein